MPKSDLIVLVATAAMSVLAQAPATTAQTWPEIEAPAPEPKVRIELRESHARPGPFGDLAVGVAFLVEGERPLRITGAAASIGEEATLVRRTKFMGFEVAYDVDAIDVEPGVWTRFAGEDGGVLISGVGKQDLERTHYLLYFDCGDAGVCSLSVPLADIRPDQTAALPPVEDGTMGDAAAGPEVAPEAAKPAHAKDAGAQNASIRDEAPEDATAASDSASEAHSFGARIGGRVTPQDMNLVEGRIVLPEDDLGSPQSFVPQIVDPEIAEESAPALDGQPRSLAAKRHVIIPPAAEDAAAE